MSDCLILDAQKPTSQVIHLKLECFYCLSNNPSKPPFFQVGSKMEEEQFFDFSEPLPPRSFSFDENEDAEVPQQNNTGHARILFRSFSAPEENSQINLEPDYLTPV